MTGPADNPSDRPTQLRPVGTDNPITQQGVETAADDAAPDPWYRNRLLLALWVVVVALLLTLVVYGIVGLSRDDGQTSGPAGSTPSSTPARSATTSASVTTTTAPSTTETSAEPPEQTPENAPPPPNGAPAPAEPPRHHHRPHIPSTITLPHTVITLPHGF